MKTLTITASLTEKQERMSDSFGLDEAEFMAKVNKFVLSCGEQNWFVTDALFENTKHGVFSGEEIMLLACFGLKLVTSQWLAEEEEGEEEEEQ